MVVLFASLSALTYGAADFYGGMASRKNSAITVVLWSQGIGFLISLIAAPLLGSSSVSVGDILWGISAGLAGAAGVGVLYRGLAFGLAAVVSPVAALTGSIIPVIFAVFAGERPELMTWIGVSLILPAIFFLSSEKGEKKKHVLKSLKLGFLAGCGFGGFFILIAQTGADSGMWPLLAARAATVPIFLAITLLSKLPVAPCKNSMGYAVIAGALDMGANIFYLLATRTGLMVTAVIISSLYPAPTVFLQYIVRGEKINFLRVFGIILAITGAILIGIGS